MPKSKEYANSHSYWTKTLKNMNIRKNNTTKSTRNHDNLWATLGIYEKQGKFSKNHDKSTKNHDKLSVDQWHGFRCTEKPQKSWEIKKKHGKLWENRVKLVKIVEDHGESRKFTEKT